MPAQHEFWWQKRATVLCLSLLAMVPLLWPSVPPLVDLPGHMGRFRVQLDYADSAFLRQYYSFKWELIGNLGVDLLIIPFSKVFGLELGVKIIIVAIPAMVVAGLLWIAREVHGEVPPTALFAVPLAYGHPFMFGFVNFSLAMALALLVFALWLRLARLGHLRLRAGLFLFIGPLLWVTHTFGWGTLGVLAFSAELIRQHDKGGSWPRAIFWASIHCLCLAPPILLMLLWRSGQVGGQTADMFNWKIKWGYAQQILRDRWKLFDLGSAAVLAGVLLFALFHRRLTYSRNLAASALFLLAVYVLLPRIVFGSAYADMRLAPFVVAIAIIAIRPKPIAGPVLLGGLAIAGIAFAGTRLAANTVSLAMAGQSHARAMVALDKVPENARLISFVGHRCPTPWAMNRNWHLPGMALVRKSAFSNDQWDMAGAQLLRIRNPAAGRFAGDPSQVVVAGPCANKWRNINWSLANLPRKAFDYVWLIETPRFDPALLRGMTPLWSDGKNALYRIDDRTAMSPAS